MKSRRQANVAATRAALIVIARKHFARHGYSGAEIGGIARDARLTTGAVYHHFSSKQGLFQAVAEQLESEILTVATGVEAVDPWQRLRLGFEKLIDFCASADVQRIIFIEAPQVIGPAGWSQIELRYAFGALRRVLGALRDAGKIKRYPIDLLARVLLSLLHECSAEVARSQGNPGVRAQIADLVAGVFDVLAVP
jgi:AcrR family transcriptional regulator